MFTRRLADVIGGPRFSLRLFARVPVLFTLGCTSTAVTPSLEPGLNLACDGLPQASTSPLALEQQSITTRVLTAEELPGVRDEYEPVRLAGISASVPAAPGWSRAWLERRILCYRQLHPESARDVLLVRGSSVRVRESHSHFEVLITSDDAHIAQQIVEAAGLSSSGPIGRLATTR